MEVRPEPARGPFRRRRPRGTKAQEEALLGWWGDVAVGRSPTVAEIEALARRSRFRSILNLDTEGEPGEILSPNVEASWAHTFEMRHERVSVDLRHLRSEQVDRFLEVLDGLPRPVYLCSVGGRRAAAFATIGLGIERGRPGREALEEARALGFDCRLEQLERFVAQELDRRVRLAGAARAELERAPSA